MIAAIVIASVVAYAVGSGVTYGFLHTKFMEEDPRAPIGNRDGAAFFGAFWPITWTFYALRWAVPRMLGLPVRLGRRLATPKQAALPEARVVSKEHP